MTSEQIMYKIFILCYKNNIEFSLEMDENLPNQISFDEKGKILRINISDEDDKNLKNKLNEKYKELKQLL